MIVAFFTHMLRFGKVTKIIIKKKQGESMAEPPKALQLSRPVRPSAPFSVAGTCMVRRATFNLLVQLRRRTSRPYSLELEHAEGKWLSRPRENSAIGRTGSIVD
jgi:hypothetical protein